MCKLFASLALLFFFGTASAQYGVKKDSKSQPISHQQWTDYLAKHVSGNGSVRYADMKADIAPLKAYLKLLSENHPSPTWSKSERMAYWINAYNAFTIDLVLSNYPINSIRAIGAKIQVPHANTPWDIKFISIERYRYDLNDIEHKILDKMNDPRIHFAIVCASVSCPRLRTEAYVAEKLEEQLKDQTRQFLADKTKNQIHPSKPVLSSIFQWFAADFKSEGGVVNFINKYSDTKIDSNAEITYLKYNWNLNE